MSEYEYYIEVDGSPVTGLSFAGGKATVITGKMADAIRYTADEAAEAAQAVGHRAIVYGIEYFVRATIGETIYGRGWSEDEANADCVAKFGCLKGEIYSASASVGHIMDEDGDAGAIALWAELD